MTSSRRRSRARRVLGVIGAVIGCTATFVSGVAAAAVIHLDVPATKRLVATQTNGILAKQFKGTVQIERIGSLGLTGVRGVTVRIHDPEGMQVLHVDGAEVRIRGVAAAKSALFGKGPIHIDVPRVVIDHADVSLDGNTEGQMRLAKAFEPRDPKPPEPEDPNARGVRVEAPEVVLRHAWVHGATAPNSPAVDAELKGLAANAHVDPRWTRATIDRVDLVTRNLPNRVDPNGRLRASLALPAKTTAEDKLRLEAAFEGAIAGMRTTLDASMDGDRIDARLDAAGQGFTTMLGETGSRQEVTLRADVHGELPRLDANANLAIGDGTVDVAAKVDTSESTHVTAHVAARHIDLSAIAKGAPSSDLGLDAAADVTLEESGPRGAFAVETQRGRIEKDDIPRVRLRGTAVGERVDVSAKIEEASMPTQIDVSVIPQDGERIVEASVRSRIPDLRKIPRTNASFGGSALVEADARIALDAKTIDATARVDGKSIVQGDSVIRDLHTRVRATGTFDKPAIDAQVFASGIASSGGLAADRVDARAHVDLGETTIVSDAAVTLRRGRETVEAHTDKVSVGRALEVKGAVVEGLGEPIRAEIRKDARGMEVNVDAPRIELVRVARILGRDKDLTSGTVAIAANVALRPHDAQGEVKIRAEKVAAKSLQNTNVTLDAKVDGRSVDVNLDASFDTAGRVRLHTENLVIDGSPTEPGAWQRAHGRVAFDSAIELARVVELAPEGSLPVSELAGELDVVGTFGRESPTATPEIHLHGHTLNLVVGGAAPTEADLPDVEAIGAAPWRSRGVDVGFDLETDARSGHTAAAFRATDGRGAVAALDAKADVPYAEILAKPSEAKALLTRAPLSAKLVVPSRELSQMPEVFGLRGIHGNVNATLDVTGTAREPLVKLVAEGKGVRATQDMPKTDARIVLDYDGKKAKLAANVRADDKDALAANAELAVKTTDILDGKGELPWNASARVRFAGFPVETIPMTADFKMKGRVTGDVVVEGLHEDANAQARIDLAGLEIGGAKYTKGTIAFDAEDGRLDANVRLEQEDGFANLHASTGMAWGARVAPVLDEKQSVDARFEAKAFRAAAIQPFVSSAVNGLDGRIDADARFALDRAHKKVKMEGGLSFREGKMQIEALGEEFRDVRATVKLDPNGTVKVTDVFLRSSIEGELRADAEAKLEGLRLAHAKANVSIPEKRPLDLAAQGQPIGEVHGDVHVDATTNEAGDMKVVVDVPRLGVDLPQVTKSGVQQLEEKKNIRVGVYREKQTFVRLPLDKEDLEPVDPTPAKPKAKLDVDVRLGEISIQRGNQASVVLEGNPKISIANDTQLGGQIRVKKGWVDIQGKKFEIEKGIVTFTGESPPNPVVVLTAAWTAQDNTRVYADFVGPVKTGKVNLRSEPPRPKNEILAIILFGSADGANPTPARQGKASDGTAKAAVGLGGGMAAQGLNEALEDLGGIEANVRIDTTNSNNPRPEVELQIAPKIAVRFAHVIGTPPVTEPDKNLATVEWHFRPRWSLETTFGDRGTALLDAIWQKRY